MNTIAIVVTFNRKHLLERCLFSLKTQSMTPKNILIVDNASTDGTYDWFSHSDYRKDPRFLYLRLPSNTGGAGGFKAGMEFFQKGAYDWAWIMDDDAFAAADALEKLMLANPTPENIYGSIAIDGESTSWAITIIQEKGNITTNKLENIPRSAKVTFLPFLGLLIHQKTIEKIGLPDADFFIAGDDLEYCLRARRNNIDILAIKESLISHPKAEIQSLYFLGLKLNILKIPAWKSYYNTRNKILISKKYYGYKLITKTIPGILLRMMISLLFEPKKISNFYSTTAGLFDGLFGLKGKRHIFWKIK